MAFDIDQVKRMKEQLNTELSNNTDRSTVNPDLHLTKKEYKRACNIMLKPSTRSIGQSAADKKGLSLSNYIELLILNDQTK